MKRFIISMLIAGTFLPAAGQSASEEIQANPAFAAGKYYAYQAPKTSLTAAPDGYKPFYISAFARHGSRYLTKRRNTMNRLPF